MNFLRERMKMAEQTTQPGAQSPVVRGGDFLFVSMRCGRHNRLTGEKNTTIETQTVQCLKKMAGFLEESGSSFEDIVQITVLLADAKNMPAMEKAYQSCFKGKQPARAVIVTPLSSPDMLIQMGCTAYHPIQK
jgi:2-iminobutanoate/2-iminopropanoate deaminase